MAVLPLFRLPSRARDLDISRDIFPVQFNSSSISLFRPQKSDGSPIRSLNAYVISYMVIYFSPYRRIMNDRYSLSVFVVFSFAEIIQYTPFKFNTGNLKPGIYLDPLTPILKICFNGYFLLYIRGCGFLKKKRALRAPKGKRVIVKRVT
jgi:hypothetical protein